MIYATVFASSAFGSVYAVHPVLYHRALSAGEASDERPLRTHMRTRTRTRTRVYHRAFHRRRQRQNNKSHRELRKSRELPKLGLPKRVAHSRAQRGKRRGGEQRKGRGTRNTGDPRWERGRLTELKSHVNRPGNCGICRTGSVRLWRCEPKAETIGRDWRQFPSSG